MAGLIERYRKAVICASTGNTAASVAAYAVRAGLTRWKSFGELELAPHERGAAPRRSRS